jgi:hypothetical protein
MICRGRAAATSAKIAELQQAVTVYALEQGTYPPEDPGFGTASLVKALQSYSAKKAPYAWFDPSELDTAGNIRNLVRPATEIIHYRNNAPNFPANAKDPAVHNAATFDLWATGCAGLPDELNSWGN